MQTILHFINQTLYWLLKITESVTDQICVQPAWDCTQIIDRLLLQWLFPICLSAEDLAELQVVLSGKHMKTCATSTFWMLRKWQDLFAHVDTGDAFTFSRNQSWFFFSPRILLCGETEELFWCILVHLRLMSVHLYLLSAWLKEASLFKDVECQYCKMKMNYKATFVLFKGQFTQIMRIQYFLSGCSDFFPSVCLQRTWQNC